MPSFEDSTEEPAEPAEPPATLGDVITRWRYTLTPQLYVDESADVHDLLWQQVLEQRAVRGWLVVIAVLVLLAPLVTVVLILTLT